MCVSKERPGRFSTFASMFIAVLALSVADLNGADPAKEVSEETRALIKTNVSRLRSNRSSERVQAAEALGELGAKAKSARRALCAAMLDSNQQVRTAVADALKMIDPKIHELAVSIYVNAEMKSIAKAGNLKEEGEPLTPLVIAVTRKSALELAKRLQATAAASATRSRGGRSGAAKRTSIKGVPRPLPHEEVNFCTCLTALSQIAKNDEASNKLIISALLHVSPATRYVALKQVRQLRHSKLALQPIAEIAKTDLYEENRLLAIDLLPAIIDENTEKPIVKTLESMRYDQSSEVRKAVDKALEKAKKNR